MNKRLLNVIVFILGATAGALGGVYAVKTKYQQLADKEIEEYKAFSDEKIKICEEIYRQQAEAVVGELRDYGQEKPTHKEEEVEEFDGEVKVINGKATYIPADKQATVVPKEILSRYNTLTEKKDLDEVMRERGLSQAAKKPVKWDHPIEDEAEEDEQPDAPIIEQADNSIELISTEEFLQGKPEYEKITLTYYDGDDVLTDERDTMVPSPTDIVGLDALQSFGRERMDPNVVYVRNHKSSCDFEIILNKSSYVEVILGAPAESKVHNSAKKPIRKNKPNGEK